MVNRESTMWVSQERYPSVRLLHERMVMFFQEHAEAYPVVMTTFADALWQQRRPLVQLMEGLPTTFRHYLCDPFVVRDIASFVGIGQHDGKGKDEDENEGKDEKEEKKGKEEEEDEGPYVCNFDMTFLNAEVHGYPLWHGYHRRLRIVLTEEPHSILHGNKVFQVHGLKFVWREKAVMGLPDGYYAFRAKLYEFLR